MDFIAEAGDRPWCLHLSYIKPHWPYIAPAPYNAMFGAGDVLPVVRSRGGAAGPASRSIAEFMDLRVSQTFAREEVREEVIPVYMGLIKQIDDQLGRLFRFLQERGLLDTTMIVFTSDHGDYLGDHWMGEKDLFHEPSVKVPLIVFDPSPAADGARGTMCDALVEAIDLIPTFLEALGADPVEQAHRLEGRSLVPFLRGAAARPMAPVRHQRVRLLDAAGGGEARRRAARRAPLHDRRQALEAGPRLGLPAHALRSRGRPQRVSRSGRRSGLRGRAAPAHGRAQRLGAAPVAAHDASRSSRSATGAASRSAAAS